MPVLTYDSLDAIDEGLREGAKEVDGKFQINVTPMAKLEEFRTNNTKLLKEKDTLTAQVSTLTGLVGEDAEAFTAELSDLRALKQGVDDGKYKTNDAVNQEVTKRVATVVEDNKAQLAELGRVAEQEKQARMAAEKALDDSYIDRAITEAVMHEDSGMRSEAIQDIMTRARQVWTVNKETKQLVATNGDAILYGLDGVTPMKPLEWMGKLREQAPHLALPSNGGSAAGNTGDKKFGGKTAEEFQKLPPEQRMLHSRKMG